MKKSFQLLSVVLLVTALLFSSCSKSEDDDPKKTDPNQNVKVSSYTLVIAGVTSTEVVGEITVCPDGYFGIIGSTPDGEDIVINSSKIMVGETREICSVNLPSDEFLACVDSGGFNISGFISGIQYSPSVGTATRTTTNDIEVSGVLINMTDLSEHAFTLEATAGLVSPFNCE